MFAWILILVFLSGLTGLIYQVAWQKYLSIFLGSHAFATSLVLGVFFLFLSIGYWAAGRYATRLMKNKLLLYGVVELVIGLYGLVSPEIFHFLNETLAIHTTTTFTNTLLGLTFSSLFIGLPTFLMGATIPVLTYGLSSTVQESHRTHALIYGTNTLGAFVGTLVAGFWMIEEFGLPITISVVGLINVLIFVGTAIIARNSSRQYEGCPEPTSNSEAVAAQSVKSLKTSYSLAYLIAFLSGYYVFALESLIIRMAGVSIGSSTYTFTIVVSAFIAAIAVGSFLVAKAEKVPTHYALFGSQVLLLLSTIGIQWLIPRWPEIFLRLRVLIQPAHLNFEIYWLFVFVMFLAMLIPFVTFMGTNLPLLFGQLRFTGNIGSVTGRLYALNCLGSFFGAILGGYLLFHYFEPDTVFKIAVVGVALAAVSFLLLTYLHKKFERRAVAVGLGVVLFLTAFSLFMKRWDRRDFTPEKFTYSRVLPGTKTYGEFLKEITANDGKMEILASFTDPNTLVDVGHVKSKDERILYLNGKPDATSKGDHVVRAAAALFPISIAPIDVKNVFIVGLGAGLSTAIATQYSEVESVEVAEISQGVINALPYFDEVNYGLTKKSKKHTLKVGDAYKILKDSSRKYDLILSEPTNPWVSGIDKLFTSDFYSLAASKLSERGFYVQWLPAFNLDKDTLLMILRGFNATFPYTTVWHAGGLALTVIGSRQPFELDVERLLKRYNENKALYTDRGFSTPYSTLACQMLTPHSVAALTSSVQKVHTLENPVLEYEAGRTFFASTVTSIDELMIPYKTILAYHKSAIEPFLMDSVLERVPPEAIVDGIRLNGSFNVFHRDRLEMALYRKDPKNPAFVYTDFDREIHRGLSGQRAKTTAQEFLDSKNLNQFIGILRRHYHASAHIDFQYVRNVIDEKCLSLECLRNRLHMIRYAGRPKYQKEILAWSSADKDILDKKDEILKLFKEAFTADEEN